MNQNEICNRVFTQFDTESLDKAPDVNTEYFCSYYVKCKGFTHLMKLVLKENNKDVFDLILKILVDDPEQLNKQNSKGYTALMLICPYARTDISYKIIDLLLKQPNINVNLKCNIGNTALMLIPNCIEKYYNIKSFNLLLKHPNININIKNHYNHTVFDFLLLIDNLDRNIILYFIKQSKNYNYLVRYLKICDIKDLTNLQYIYKNNLYNQVDGENLINKLYEIYFLGGINKILIDKKVYLQVCQYKYNNILSKINYIKNRFENEMKSLNKDIFDIKKKIKNCNNEIVNMINYVDCEFIFH